ncbi:MAG: tRNA 2-selenouridine(34) synthase MnmH [Synechococcales cyanobacterium T60_A2020_003]|nr:tRNA 2-selenouridine(34) synthase MnmH [Synechococcales cyanobacterium T60_A2020_003]
MVRSVDVSTFLSAPGLMLDVRSPGEYADGHIPGAIRFPLFTNEERAMVGTCYKQEGRDRAIGLGLELVGPKLADFVKTAKQLAGGTEIPLQVHCWRGGMRSGSMAWLLETAGFKVITLTGGYKAFRRWVRDTCAMPKPILTLGGMTGTGKTAILHKLAQLGEPVLDLEALANHRGSSYGALGLDPQPTNEQFENDVAIAWAALPVNKPIWIEAESRRIGLCRVPPELFQQMMSAPIVQVVRSRAERVDILVEVYKIAPVEELINATQRIHKKLGGLRTQEAIAHIQQNRLADACDMILDYYDKTYQYDLERRGVDVQTVDVTGLSATAAAKKLQAEARCRSSPTPLANV